jgi:SRSO17 transposase
LGLRIALLNSDRTQQTGRWLLMRRGIEDPNEYAYYLAYGPTETPVHELIQIAGRRWSIEDSFEVAKGKVGLDEYEVRKWEGWHRHITLCLLAHAFLVVVRSVAEHEEGAAKGGPQAKSLPRADPTDCTGGQASDPGDGGTC